MEFAANRKETVILNPTKDMARKGIPSTQMASAIPSRAVCQVMGGWASSRRRITPSCTAYERFPSSLSRRGRLRWFL